MIVYFLPYLVLAISMYGFYLGSWFYWLGFAILFFVFPIVEVVSRNENFNSDKYKSSKADYALYIMPFFLTVLFIIAFLKVNEVETRFQFVGLILSTGSLLGGFGITSAHELVHRREKKLRALGVYNLMLVNFAHWGLEHVFGHHKNVSTPKDPATAKKNEWLYAFWFRNYFGSLCGAYKISLKKVIFYWSISLLISFFIYAQFGLKYLIFWWGSSIVATLLLQTVDYIEHYGLQRTKNGEGGYTAFRDSHSWDTNSYITNALLFNLGFHSHHHLKASLPFSELVEQKNAQRMPFGYSAMILLAFVPFVYIPYMNRRLKTST